MNPDQRTYLLVVDDGKSETFASYRSDALAIKGARNKSRSARRNVSVFRNGELHPFKVVTRRAPGY